MGVDTHTGTTTVGGDDAHTGTTTVGDKKGSKQSLALTISRELFLSIRVLFSINILTGRYRLFQFNSLYVLQDRM